VHAEEELGLQEDGAEPDPPAKDKPNGMPKGNPVEKKSTTASPATNTNASHIAKTTTTSKVTSANSCQSTHSGKVSSLDPDPPVKGWNLKGIPNYCSWTFAQPANGARDLETSLQARARVH
jgi:hypothetical protein